MNPDFTNFVSRLLGLTATAQFIGTYYQFKSKTRHRALQLPRRSRFTVTIGRSISDTAQYSQSSDSRSHLVTSFALKSCPLTHESWINNRINSIFSIDSTQLGAGIAQSVHRIATGWTVRGSNPGRGEIFRTRQDRL
jgi:hypothetical protein